MSRRGPIAVASIAVAAAMTLAGCASASNGSGGSSGGGGGGGTASGPVKLGLSTELSGSLSSLGKDSLHGIELAVSDLNAKGGLLGRKLKLVTADDGGEAATGASNARHMVQDQKVSVLFGPVPANVGLAEQQIAAQAKVPFLYSLIATDSMTLKDFNKYAFRIRPDTYSAANAVVNYVSKNLSGNGPHTFYSISPDYSYGHQVTQDVISDFKKAGVKLNIAGQAWPKLQATSFTQYISAAQSAHPDLLFLGVYGGDYSNLVKQSSGYGLFSKATTMQYCPSSTLTALKDSAPTGAICWAFAEPPYLMKGDAAKKVINEYDQKYGSLPSDESLLAYKQVLAWSDGVKKANSFDGTKVANALEGLQVTALDSTFKIRACDHEAELPVYVGKVGSSVDSKWGQKLLTDVSTPAPADTMRTCSAAQSQQK